MPRPGRIPPEEAHREQQAAHRPGGQHGQVAPWQRKPGLAGHVADGELMLPSADVTADLALLVGWARGNHLDLTGLEVGSPSLEDAYLALTSEEGAENRG